MLYRIFGTLISSRFLFTLFLVFGFYNPFGYSYYHWVMATGFTDINDPTDFGKIVIGLAFAAAMMFFIYSIWRAPAKPVYFILLLVVVAIVWWAQLQGLIDLADPTVSTIIAEVLIAFALTLGSIWSIIWFGKTGERAVYDTDDNAAHDHN